MLSFNSVPFKQSVALHQIDNLNFIEIGISWQIINGIYLNLSPSLMTSKQLVSKIPSFSFQICLRSVSLTPGWLPRASLYAYPTSHSAVNNESSSIIRILTAVVVTFGQNRSQLVGVLFNLIHFDFLQSKNPFNFILSRSASIEMPSALNWHR